MELSSTKRIYEEVVWHIGLTIAPSEKKEGADKQAPNDWGQIYAKLLDLGLGYDEIPKRTYPQIQALLGGRAGVIVEKMSMPNIFGYSNNAINTTVEESSQEDVEAFFNGF